MTGAQVRDHRRRTANLSGSEGRSLYRRRGYLKSRNPNSVVKLKDLKTGKEIVVSFKVAQQ